LITTSILADPDIDLGLVNTDELTLMDLVENRDSTRSWGSAIGVWS
jgi:phosphoribosylaminoimidazole-succinocarboxamide synthase